MSRRTAPHFAHRAAPLLALLLCLASTLAFAIDFPPLTGRVSDEANLIPQQARAALTEKLKELEDKSGIQLVVATVDSLQDQNIEDYANGLFRAWKLGEAKKNNGALFLVAPHERKMRIEVGYGLEGVLTDAVSKIIIATVVTPRFKAGDFAGGIERGVDAIVDTLSGDTSEWTKRARAGPDSVDSIAPLIIFALFLFIFAIMVMNSRGPVRRGYGGYRRGGGGPIIFLPPGDSSWGGDRGGDWGSGGGSDWGGDGGFSGGGGSSGGGGASGDW